MTRPNSCSANALNASSCRTTSPASSSSSPPTTTVPVVRLRRFFLKPVPHAVPLHAAGYDFDDCDLTSVGQAIKKPIKVRSKVALRFAGAKVSNAPIVVSAAMSYGKLRSVRHATVRNEYNVGSNRGGATTDTDIR
jgi:hypothetical protein